MRQLALQPGEDLLAATLIPLVVDGTIVAARVDVAAPCEPVWLTRWTPAVALLVLSSLASLGANIAPSPH
ncbi:hypothetical protein [Nonomuraea sp. NPDC050691]|uniref:hypothetical protein n=1 Tax=Nonomuraea sp. NPDC050691 TaxID=3155661 RepID=UPI0033E3C98A